MAVRPGWFVGLIDTRSLASLSGLSVSTITRFNTGRFRPSAQTLNNLDQIYRQIQTARLFGAGLSSKEAMRFSGKAPEDVEGAIDTIERIIKNMADNYGVSADIIRRQMERSDKSLEQFEDSELISIEYAKEQRRKNRRRSR